MPFRNRRSNMSIRPVHRIKHVVDRQGSGIAGTQISENIIVTKDAPVLAQAEEVETGCKVNGIYLHLEVTNTTAPASLPNMYMFVAKNQGSNLTFPNGNLIGIDDNKRFVIHQEMLMMQKQQNSNPRTLFNGVIVIPKGYRRFGPNDIITVRIFSPGIGYEYCLQAHYKEFR